MDLRMLIAIGVAASLTALGCGSKDKPYKPKPAYSGKKPSLPQVPTLPNKKKKDGDAYNVWGAIHDLHSVVHAKDFQGKQVSLVGWIVQTNYDKECQDENKPAAGESCVPKCAIHKTGKGDEADCKAPVPTFWIADDKDEKDIKGKAIPVKGWSSNFAQMYTLIEGLDKDDDAKLQDEFFGMDLPVPLPALGGKAKITGSYGFTYTKSTGGAASNPRTGIMTAEKIEWPDKPPKRAVLPGMKVKNTDNE